MIINIDIDESLFPKLLEIEKDKLDSTIKFLLNIGYQNVFSSVNERNLIDNMNNICRKFKDDIISGVDSKNDNIQNRIELLQNNLSNLDVNNKLEDFSKILEKLFGISASSSKKGQISEQLIYKIIEDKYPNYSYDVKRHIAHHADGELSSPSGLVSLVEIKNYTNTVNKDEIDKFKFDLEYTNNQFGIFISLQTGISGKSNIDYETYQDSNNKTYHIIYISKMMEEALKLDCGILLLESLYKMNKKDNIDLKIDQIKNIIYQNFNELEVLLNKTSNLRNEYENLEKVIKTNFDIFYNHLRNYEIEVKQNMQKIWLNLFNDLKDIEKNYIDMKTQILLDIGEKDKCYLIISRLFDFFNKKNINVTTDDSLYYLSKQDNQIGTIKKMKDKIQLNINTISIIIIFKYNDDNLDRNIDFLNHILDKI
jgi:hypothetical protein